ncbi:class I SAM-dependent methyltransferase [Deferribacterales bacterium RsTz2092]
MPQTFISNDIADYELIDAGNGLRLERWGTVTLVRPDPTALWQASDNPLWKSADARYHRSSSGGGRWEFMRKVPDEWRVHWGNLTFKVRLTGFKHTGLFPEQAHNWRLIENAIKNAGRPLKLLNLFGYTGAASVVATKAGASVCHVDSSKGMLDWCRENADLSGVNNEIRLIADDCLKFVLREGRRGTRYDAIVMDPPSFGRGAKGEVWKFEYNIAELLTACKAILSDKPLFLLISAYTAGISSITLDNVASSLNLPFTNTSCGELALPFRGGKMLLPCGLTLFMS